MMIGGEIADIPVYITSQICNPEQKPEQKPEHYLNIERPDIISKINRFMVKIVIYNIDL